MILEIQALYSTDVSWSAKTVDVSFHAQEPHSEDGRDLHLTPSGHLQRPDKRHRQDQNDEI